MDSTHFGNLYKTLLTTLLSVIKNRIERYHIYPLEKEAPLINVKTEFEKEYKFKKIKMLSSELIFFDDNTSISWDGIKNFEDLLSIFEFIEEWFRLKEDDSFKIIWSIEDFEDRALDMEEDANGNTKQLFDRSKFRYALKILEDQHDYNNGICWNDVDDNLNTYCKLEK